MKWIIIIAGLFAIGNAKANFADTTKIYNPEANAQKDIAAAVEKAKAEHKHVLIQAGGNWCIWCMRFNALVTTDKQLDSLVKADYIVYHLNYSKENVNDETFAQYGFPQRFGFPVFIIIDANGNRIHTQNSEYLEQDKGYSKEKVMDFLEAWSPAALNPDLYKAH